MKTDSQAGRGAPRAPLEVRNEALLERRGLLPFFAKRHRLRRGRPYRDRDDMAQDAALLFLLKYDPGREYARSSFIRLCFSHAIAQEDRRMQVGRNKRRKHAERMALHAPPHEPPPGEELAPLREALAKLDRSARLLLTERFGLDGRVPKTFRQMADEAGITHQGAQHRVNVSLNLLRSILAKKGVTHVG